MIGVPEVVLPVERGIPRASLRLIANPAIGLSDAPVTVDGVTAAVAGVQRP